MTIVSKVPMLNCQLLILLPLWVKSTDMWTPRVVSFPDPIHQQSAAAGPTHRLFILTCQAGKGQIGSCDAAVDLDTRLPIVRPFTGFEL